MTDRNLSEDQARALWERAARLQAEAAAQDMAPVAPEAEPAAVGDYTLDVVRKAATEAGIGAEFVEQALQEFAPAGEMPRKSDEWADRLLGDEVRMVRVSRVIDKPLAEVFEAMRRVLPNSPFGLSLTGITGGDPLEGGIMSFEVPNATGMGGSGAATSKAIFGIRHWADIPEVRFRIRPIHDGDKPERTEIECSASLSHARRMNFWAGVSVSGVLGVLTAAIGGAVAAATLGPAAIALKVGVVGGFGLGGYAGSRRAWRPVYRYGQNKGREGIERLLDAIVVDMQTGGAFTPRIEPRQEASSPQKLLKDLGL